eukprot:gene10094-11125_t
MEEEAMEVDHKQTKSREDEQQRNNTSVSPEQEIGSEEEWEEGHLLKLFKIASETCIDKCLNAKQMAKCYKQLWRNNKEMLQPLFEQILLQTESNLKKELDSLIQSESLDDLLLELDKLVRESQAEEHSSSKISWRPSGYPENDCRAHIIAKKHEVINNMEQQLQETQLDEAKLREDVCVKRQRLQEILSQIETKTANSKAIAMACSESGVENDATRISAAFNMLEKQIK